MHNCHCIQRVLFLFFFALYYFTLCSTQQIRWTLQPEICKCNLTRSAQTFAYDFNLPVATVESEIQTGFIVFDRTHMQGIELRLENSAVFL